MKLKCIFFFVLNICLSLASDLLIKPDDKEITINEGTLLQINCTGSKKMDLFYSKNLAELNILLKEISKQEDNDGNFSTIIFNRQNASYNDIGWYGCVSNKYSYFHLTRIPVTPNLLNDPNIRWIYVNVKSTPSIRNKETNIGYYLQNTKRQFKCEAYGYPLPSIEWNYSDNFNELIINSTRNISTSAISMTEVISTIQLIIGPSGNLSCKACNDLGCYTSIIQTIFTLDVPYGFGMEKPTSNVAVGDVFQLTCYASIYRHTNNIRWFNGSKRMRNSGRIHIQPTIIKHHSYVSELSIYNINLQDANYYTCQGETKDSFRKLDICALSAFDEDLSFMWIGNFYELILTLFCIFIIIQFSVISIYFLLKLWSNDF